MSFVSWVSKILNAFMFNQKWTCSVCGTEIFEDEYFCKDCLSKLPINTGAYCEHCGRQTIVPETYCLTCKDKLTYIDLGRSAFVYEDPISYLIKGFKYDNKKYLANVFSQYLSSVYFKNTLSADFIVFPPMTEKSQKRRGYNQAKLLAEKTSKLINVPAIDVVKKVKETPRQATLNRAEREKNLENAFRITKRKILKDKNILIIDDVTTTGTTANVIAKRLKNAGAKHVYVLTVASVRSYK